MNKFKKLFVATLAGLVVAGCASTTAEGPAKYPELKVLSNTPYVWDNSISEALNVARMGQPSGVGVGMKDFVDGKNATTGRYSGGTRLFDAGLGLLGQGVFGVVAMESLNQGVNRQLDWKPAIISTFKYDVKDEALFLKLRKDISDSIWNEIKREKIDVKLVGVGTLKSAHANLDNKYIHNVSLIFQGDFCKKARKFDGADDLNMVDASKHFYDIPSGTSGFCSIDLRVSISSKNADGSLIVTSEMLSGFAFLDAIVKMKDSYVIFPDYFTGLNSKTSFQNNYSFVTKNGEKYFFQK